ncbi:MAG TPA: SGNH family hydrolase [Xanthobacteraceae bacterium]|nr:SGNH family hydrolase [Xanthobacteraceae bacterium]
MVQRKQILAVAAAVAAAVLALPAGAQAQFFGGGWGYQPYRPAPPSNGFSFPFFGRPRSYAPPAESYRAPPPRKLENPPSSTVVVVGDSMADWLAYGLEEIYADNQQIGVTRNVRQYSGLVRYEPRNETLQWPQAIKDALAAEKPTAIVVMLGLNDRTALRERVAPAKPAQQPQDGKQDGKQDDKQDGKSTPPATAGTEQKPEERPVNPRHPGPSVAYEFRSDQWAQAYKKRIDEMITVLKSKGVPVLWVGLPAIRGPRATADISYLDDLYHAEADKLGVTYVDIWDGFVDEDGRYTVQGPDFEGQTRRLRTGDGIHFTKYGALKLAHLVDQDLSHILANPAAPVALSAPQAAAPAKPGTTRPTIGPVLPLTAPGGGGQMISGGEAGGLLGAGGNAAPLASENPTVKNALVRGDPLAAPPGRADNFAWPQGDAAANAAPPVNAPAAR